MEKISYTQGGVFQDNCVLRFYCGKIKGVQKMWESQVIFAISQKQRNCRWARKQMQKMPTPKNKRGKTQVAPLSSFKIQKNDEEILCREPRTRRSNRGSDSTESKDGCFPRLFKVGQNKLSMLWGKAHRISSTGSYKRERITGKNKARRGDGPLLFSTKKQLPPGISNTLCQLQFCKRAF